MFVVGCRVLTLDCWVMGVAFSGCCLCLVVGCWLLIVDVGYARWSYDATETFEPSTVKKGLRVSRPQPGCHYQTLPGRD
jgi:hypothetical protein